MPILFIFRPDIFDNSYILIIISRYIRIILAANILTANEKLSASAVTSQLYKMLINLGMLIVISALLFTGLENQTNLAEIKTACHISKPSTCLDTAFAAANPDKCATNFIETCDKLLHK